MDQDIFRPKALKRLSQPEQLDELISVTVPLGWIGLLTIAGLMAVLLFWAIFAKVPTTVSGKGVLIYAGEVIPLVAASDGTIDKIEMKSGQIVKKWQVLGRVFNYGSLNNIKSLQGQLRSTQDQRGYAQVMDELNKEMAQQRFDAFIVAPEDGLILEVATHTGESVTRGQHLAILNVVPETGALEARLYFSAADGKQIRQGMEVKLAMDNLKPDKYGYLIGRVNNVTLFPASSQFLAEQLGNDQLVKLFTSGTVGALLQVNVSLLPEKNPSGYLWTSEFGQNERVECGSTLTGNVVVRRESPISIAFKWLGNLLTGS